MSEIEIRYERGPGDEGPQTDRTHLYMRTGADRFARLLSFKRTRRDELLVVPYGLDGPSPMLDLIWEETVVASDNLDRLRYRVTDATAVAKEADHFTCHLDGTFHLKTKDETDLYIQRTQTAEPLGVQTKTFLNFILISDTALLYRSFPEVIEDPCMVCQMEPDSFIYLRGAFAGLSYPHDKLVVDTLSPADGLKSVKGVEFNLNPLRGLIWAVSQRWLPARPPSLPRGSFLAFKLPRSDGRWTLKAFQFS